MPIAILCAAVTLGGFALFFCPAATTRVLLRLAQVPNHQLYASSRSRGGSGELV